MRRRYTAEQRTELLHQVTIDGVKLAAAAARVGVPYSTAARWVRMAGRPASARRRKVTSELVPARAPSSAPTFVRLIRAAAADAVIHLRVGRAQLEIRHGFDASLLRAIVAALSEDGP